MIRFKQFLIEVFDNPVKYQSTRSPSLSEARYKFTINDIDYYVGVVGEDKKGPTGTDIKTYTLTFHVDFSYHLSKKNDGSQYRIFATVKDIIFNHFAKVKLNEGDMIIFDTFDPRTASLYTKFAKELAKRTQTKLVTGTTGNGKDFNLVK